MTALAAWSILHRIFERGGIFSRFRDIAFFREFRVNPELGVLTWQNEIDIAPEMLYAQATGSPLPDWMTPEAVQS